MKKTVQKIIIALLSLSLLLGITGCGDEVNENGQYIEADAAKWKTKYLTGDTIDLTGLSILFYPDVSDMDSYETVPVTADMVRGFDTSSPGKKEITISYKGMVTDPVSYTVTENTPIIFDVTLCIDKNTTVKLDSADMSATVTSYPTFADLAAGKNSTVNELELTFGTQSFTDGTVEKAGKFTYKNVTYSVIPSGERYTVIVTGATTEGDHTSTTQKSFHAEPFSADRIPSPLPGILYTSEADDSGRRAVAVFDADFSIKVYLTNADVTSVAGLAPVITFPGNTAALNTSLKLGYSVTNKDESTSIAMLSSDGELELRLRGLPEGSLSFTCMSDAN